MPSHVHIVIYPKNERYSTPDILKSIKLSASKREIKYLKRHQPATLRLMETGLKYDPYRFWQDGGGYDRNVRNYRELTRFTEYVHNNPVSAGLVDKAVDWKWSSARDWLLDEEGPIPINKRSFPVL